MNSQLKVHMMITIIGFWYLCEEVHSLFSTCGLHVKNNLFGLYV